MALHGIVEIFRFFLEAKTYAEPDRAALQAAGVEAGRHAIWHRWIVRVSCLFGAVGFPAGVVPLVVLLTVPNAGQIKTDEEGLTFLVGPIVFAAVGLTFGAAASCLFAPRSFLSSPVGQKWLRMVGTRNILFARLVCLVVVLVIAGAVFGLILLLHRRLL